MDYHSLFMEHGALLEGHFRLSSGRHSNRYLQCARVLQYPRVARRLGEALAKQMRNIEADLVIAPAIGGILVAHEVAAALNVRAIFGERKDGKMTLRRGFRIAPGERCIVTEDVITTGKSTLEIISLVKENGGTVAAVGALADRSGGFIEALASYPIFSLMKLDVVSWDPGECPLCREGIPVESPGSRFSSK
jgi:orotate phosphoribosyltransferase